MRKRNVLLTTFFLVLCYVPSVNAILIDRGGGLLYDPDLNITWLQDASYAETSGFSPDGRMTWQQAVAWTENLVYFDSVRNVYWNDWRLPTALNKDNTDPIFGFHGEPESEMAYLFTELGLPGNGLPWPEDTSPVINLIDHDWPFWASTEYSEYPDYVAWIYDFKEGFQGINDKEFLNFAWAVRDGDVAAPVPEPSTILMIGCGILLFAIIRRRKSATI